MKSLKKLLLATAVVGVASSSMADENSFYVRVDAGASYLPKQKSYKSNTHAVAGLGVGANLMDNVRAELVLSNHFNAKQAKTVNGIKDKFKYQAMSVTVKGLVDVFNYGVGDVFVGAGVGLTKLSAKNDVTVGSAVTSYKHKAKNNFSYLATVGTSFDVSEGVRLDVAYSYNNYGKTKAAEGSNSVTLASHDFTAGVRVEL